MLILTRRQGEAVSIGADVTVRILGVKGNQVRVGISAPITVAVDREEIFKRKKFERQRRRNNAHPEDCRCDVCEGRNDA